MRNPKLEEEIVLPYVFSKEKAILLMQQNQGTDFNLEIGSGNGQFLVEIAEDEPNQFFVGCDIDSKRVRRTIKRIMRKGLKNCFVYFGRAEELLSWFEKPIFRRVYVNFPDPWPKKRHHKRRFFYPKENLDVVFSLLKEKGRLYFVSDHEEYFFFTVNERLSVYQGLTCPFEKGYTNQLENYYPTLYEEKFKKIGKDIFYTYFIKN